MESMTYKFIYELVYSTDQFFRNKIQDINNFYIKRLVWYVIKVTDSLNQKVVFLLIDKYGWPTIEQYGKKANMAAYYVLMHSDKQYMEKYYPLLKNAALKEKENCQNLCCVIDRIMLHRKKTQIFGNEARGLRDLRGNIHYFVYPIVNPKGVNARRYKVGLNSIEDHAEEYGYILEYDDKIRTRLISYK